MKQFIFSGILCLVLLMTGGCSRSTSLALFFEGEEDMNNGLLANVRVYQLTNNTAFTTVDFDVFWSGNDAFLAGESLPGTMKEFFVHPDEKAVELPLVVGKEVKYIGFAAKLHDYETGAWRRIYEVERLKKKQVFVVIEENELQVRFP